jgi:hypothetical protein
MRNNKKEWPELKPLPANTPPMAKLVCKLIKDGKIKDGMTLDETQLIMNKEIQLIAEEVINGWDASLYNLVK